MRLCLVSVQVGFQIRLENCLQEAPFAIQPLTDQTLPTCALSLTSELYSTVSESMLGKWMFVPIPEPPCGECYTRKKTNYRCRWSLKNGVSSTVVLKGEVKPQSYVRKVLYRKPYSCCSQAFFPLLFLIPCPLVSRFEKKTFFANAYRLFFKIRRTSVSWRSNHECS